MSWDGHIWTALQVVAGTSPHPLGTVSCPTAVFCVAFTTRGDAYTWNGAQWSGPTTVEPSTAPIHLSCASDDFCEAVDGDGAAFRFTAGGWTPQGVIDTSHPNAVDCPSEGTCIALDSAGRTSTYRSGGWSVPAVLDFRLPVGDGPANLTSVSCATATHCVAVDDAHSAFVYDGTRWVAGPRFAPDGSLTDVSCPDVSTCVGIDVQGRAVVGG